MKTIETKTQNGWKKAQENFKEFEQKIRLIEKYPTKLLIKYNSQPYNHL